MIIESTISQREFTRHALSRYFRRPIFYVFAFVAAILTAFVIYDSSIPQVPALLGGWIPFLVYAITGFVLIQRQSRNRDLPMYQPTRYELGRETLIVSARSGRSEIPWSKVRAWRKFGGVYELQLINGQVLLISARAIGPRQVGAFERMLRNRIEPKPEPGVFDEPAA
ncbi:YcxB family protein [Chloroflexus sp.]|uniref:YcxB family protein n=1 Tax=Chloroflexus sp. TaxID=1904827 RepID=UPI002ACD9CF4|nr:YcxB family protein [Chloroflexus sp.]